jgi:hypothetical protein
VTCYGMPVLQASGSDSCGMVLSHLLQLLTLMAVTGTMVDVALAGTLGELGCLVVPAGDCLDAAASG